MKGRTLRIAHIGDTHSRVQPHRLSLSNGYGVVNVDGGGYPLIVSAIREERGRAAREGSAFLAFHSGDSFQGGAYFRQYPGEINAALLNLMQLDAMTIGNHEFDLGTDLFIAFCSMINFPIIASNLEFPLAPSYAELNALRQSSLLTHWHSDTPALVKVLDDGLPFGIIGLTLENLSELSDVHPIIRVLDPIDTTKRLVAKLNSDGVKNVLVLSHLGEEGDKELADAVPQLSGILGGHSHRLYGECDTFRNGKTAPCGQRISGVPIFHTGADALYLGLYSLQFGSDGKVVELCGETKVPVDITSVPHVECERLTKCGDVLLTAPANDAIELLRTKFALSISQRSSPIRIEHTIEHIRVPTEHSTSQVAPIFSDAIIIYLRKEDIVVDAVIINAGVIRSSILAGEYNRVEDIISDVVPFDLDIIVLGIPGKFLKQAIQTGMEMAKQDGKSGSFPYVKFVELYPSALEDRTIYKVAVTSYLADGKDGYRILRDNAVSRLNSGVKLRTVCEYAVIDITRQSSVTRAT